MKVAAGSMLSAPQRSGAEYCNTLRNGEETPMAIPEYMICLNCESPCYVFEWKDDEVTEIVCEVCGNEELDQFLTPEEFDTLIGS